MLRNLLPRFALFALAACTIFAIALALPAGSASAHNSLSSSDPANGSTVTTAPTSITWVFDKSVPLETMTVTLIDVSGARSELSGSIHGPAGDTQVITPLPVLQPGPISVRWRLVGADGHPISDTVEFTYAAPTPTTAPASVATAPAASGTVPLSTTPFVTVDPLAASINDGVDDGVYVTSSVVRWILRYGSYLAIMAAVGILFTSAFVWPGAGTNAMLRRVLSRSLVATAILGFVQVLVVASDISGKALWSSFGSIDAATTTFAGMAFMIRIVLAIAMWIVLFRYRIIHSDVYWTAVSLPGLGLLATWAFAGHSRSMRWPAIGVATDVSHHAAAAAWIAGLAIVGWIIIPRTDPDVMIPAVRNFSRVAAISVGVLVATGVIQSFRLVGSPTDLLDANHGRYLAAKVVVLAIMLAIANANRRRVDNHLNRSSAHQRHASSLRQAILAEFAIGLVIIGITAAMVVSPPATGTPETGAPANSRKTVSYMV